MHFVIHAPDRSNANDLRDRMRPEHLGYLHGFGFIFAGPCLADDGEMRGPRKVLDV